MVHQKEKALIALKSEKNTRKEKEKEGVGYIRSLTHDPRVPSLQREGCSTTAPPYNITTRAIGENTHPQTELTADFLGSREECNRRERRVYGNISTEASQIRHFQLCAPLAPGFR